jgi:phage tail tape-measure protein
MTNSRDLTLILRLKDELSRELKGVTTSLKSMQPTFKKMAAVGTAAFAGIAAGAGVSVKAAADFESSMSNVATLLDTTVEDMGKMKAQILELAGELPVPIEELTSALYDIRSAGIPASEAISTLASAGILATAGLSRYQNIMSSISIKRWRLIIIKILKWLLKILQQRIKLCLRIRLL